ncbi:MAG: hypothetical protein QOE84_1650 [Actinomycetota bacterium]|nr:hypothetical protein [Actinomycetota bacterium]
MRLSRARQAPSVMTMRQSQVWAFDVDGCLVDSLSGTSLRPHARELLTALHQRGDTLVLWSAGGQEHGERIVSQHGLGHLFDGIYDKRGRDDSGRLHTTHLRHHHIPHVAVDDRPEEGPSTARVVGVSPYMSGDPADRGLVPLLLEVCPERTNAVT